MSILREGKMVARIMNNTVDKLDQAELEVMGARMKSKKVSNALTNKLTKLQGQVVALNAEVAETLKDVETMVTNAENEKSDTAK